MRTAVALGQRDEGHTSCVTWGKPLDLSKHVSSSGKMEVMTPSSVAAMGRFSLDATLRQGHMEGSFSVLNFLQCSAQVQAFHWLLVFLHGMSKIPRARNCVLWAKTQLVISNRDRLEISGFPV